MDFVIDRVSEDSFYENLLIGLPKILEKLPSVVQPYLERSLPVQHSLICAWEQKNGVLLPEDLRSFYASTNGLSYTYNFIYTEDESEENKIVGRIEVNSLNDLVQIFGYELCSNPGVTTEGERYELRLGSESKLFELVNLNNVGRVTLTYINHRYLPTVWIHNAAMQFYFLADNFTTYLRMCIHHLGIPYWQFSFSPEGCPEWSKMVFRLLAPSNLLNNRSIEDMRRNSKSKGMDAYGNLNKIDSSIFRSIKSNQIGTTQTCIEPLVKSRKNTSKVRSHSLSNYKKTRIVAKK